MLHSSRKPTNDLAIVPLEAPSEVHISLREQVACVAKGDPVEHGQLIGMSPRGATWQRCHHSPLRGDVIELDPCPKTGQQYVGPQIVIAGTPVPKTHVGHLQPGQFDLAEILDAIRQAGIVGMGGAMFPTYAKIANAGVIDWVLVNGCESEPYLSCDYRVLTEFRDEVECGMRFTMHALGASNGAIIAREENYPDGYEPLLIKNTLGRQVPMGGRPRDVGVVVINVQTARAIHDAICAGRPLVDRVVSVAGNAIARPGNYTIPLGTKVGHVLTACGIDRDRAHAIIAGGPMMGQVVTEEHSVTAGTGAILALTGEELRRPAAPEPCIRCGECQDACPMSLGVVSLIRHPQSAVLRCVECGSCEYRCPSERPLVALLQQAKAVITDRNRR